MLEQTSPSTLLACSWQAHFYILNINLNAKSEAYVISDLQLSIKLAKVKTKNMDEAVQKKEER